MLIKSVEIKLSYICKLLILLTVMTFNVQAQFSNTNISDSNTDTSENLDSTDSLNQEFYAKDTLNVDSLDNGPKLVMRNYNHTQQVVVGSVIMSCITILLVFMNNYNPRR